MYNLRMASQKRKIKSKKAKRGVRTKVTLVAEDDVSTEKDHNEEFDEDGMFLEKEDVKIICNALNSYKPTEKEAHLHGVLLEEFEEVLVVDYNEPYPGGN